MHEDSKLGIMTSVGKNRLVKVIFRNIHKISVACANSLVDKSWLDNVWEMFLLFIKFKNKGMTKDTPFYMTDFLFTEL